MLPALPVQIILFDLDGTLVDSIGDVAAAVNAVLERHGLAAIEGVDQRALLGEGTRARMAAAFAMRGVKLSGAEIDVMGGQFEQIYRERLVVTTKPYPDVACTLRELARRGVRMAVCTNKEERYAREILQRLGLMPPIEQVAGADSFGVRKPDPAHLLRLLDQMKADPRSAIMVGDSHHDIEAARGAGIPVLAASWGYSMSQDTLAGAQGVLRRFSQLLEIAHSPSIPADHCRESQPRVSSPPDTRS